MSEIKRIVLDVLKPHNPSLVELSKKLGGLGGVVGVNCTLEEVDRDTETVKITIEGTSIDYASLEEAIRKAGAVIHSIDSVSAGKKLVDELKTAQDR